MVIKLYVLYAKIKTIYNIQVYSTYYVKILFLFTNLLKNHNLKSFYKKNIHLLYLIYYLNLL